jgi:hypothetical protein
MEASCQLYQPDLFFINGRTNGTNKQQIYQHDIGNHQQFMIPNQQQIPPQKLHDDSNKTCKVTQHFIINKSKEPNCQRQAGTSQLAKLPRFQHAGHVASMCLKTPGFAIPLTICCLLLAASDLWKPNVP